MLRAATCILFILALSSVPAVAGPVTLLSRADPDRPSGTPGGRSEIAAVSADGRYVVSLSDADNLLPGVADTNLSQDVFLYDRVAGTTVLVSHAAGDPLTAGNRGARAAAVSADGRWVVFLSDSCDLVAGQVDTDDPGSLFAPDVFLWDRDTGLTTLVSHQAGLPTAAAGRSWNGLPIAISADGSRIAYGSFAPNLVAEQSDGGSTFDVFLYNRADGTNALVSHISGSATTAAGGAFEPALSADGSWVAFESSSAGLVAGQIDANGGSDVFLYEAATGTNVLVSHAAGAAATAANDDSLMPRISADGGQVAYSSGATNLVAGVVDGNGASDVFLYDRASGASTLVSHTSSSAATVGDESSTAPVLSADGRHVAFLSLATDLVPGASSPWPEIFVYDRITGANLLVSRDVMTPSDHSPTSPVISADGAWIAFLSSATNLVPGQTDVPSSRDAFLWSQATGSITLVTRTPGSATTAAGGQATDLRISSDGNWIALATSSTGLVDGVDDFNAQDDVFLYERATGVHTLVTSREGTVSATAGGRVSSSRGTVTSNDGRYVAFTSEAGNLAGVTFDENGGTDVFLHDRVTGAVTLVSHASGSPSTTGDAASFFPILSADGTTVVFASVASNLVSAPVAEAVGELYLYDRATGAIILVSHAAGLPATPADGSLSGAGQYAVSGDGRWIAFAHQGSDLIAGQVDGNNGGDIFLFDRATGTNTLVSHAGSSPAQAGNLPSAAPSISADGRYIAFVSGASDLVPGDPGAGIFLYDRVAATTTRVSRSGTPPLALSADGRRVAFGSGAANVVPGQLDTNNAADVFLWDRVSGATLLVSRTPASPVTTGNAESSLSGISGANTSSAPSLSADGRWVAFHSESTNLVSGQTGEPGGVFLFDRITGAVTLVSRSAASPVDNRNATAPALSADGRFVTFVSPANDLVPGQVDQGSGYDFFLYDRIAGTTSLVSHVPSSEVASGALEVPTFEPARISADGAWVAFASPEPDLVAGDHNGITDAFLHATPFPGRDLFTVPPCRILDTRQAGQGPALTSGLKRTVTAHGSCGLPETARAVVVNVTVVQPSAAGYLTFHAGDVAPEATSTITFDAGQLRSNNAVLPLSFDGRRLLAVTPFVEGNGTVHVIVDVSGYFE